jgi:hypothetical protein
VPGSRTGHHHQRPPDQLGDLVRRNGLQIGIRRAGGRQAAVAGGHPGILPQTERAGYAEPHPSAAELAGSREQAERAGGAILPNDASDPRLDRSRTREPRLSGREQISTQKRRDAETQSEKSRAVRAPAIVGEPWCGTRSTT